MGWGWEGGWYREGMTWNGDCTEWNRGGTGMARGRYRNAIGIKWGWSRDSMEMTWDGTGMDGNGIGVT